MNRYPDLDPRVASVVAWVTGGGILLSVLIVLLRSCHA